VKSFWRLQDTVGACEKLAELVEAGKTNVDASDSRRTQEIN
jgi:hypothetical protein